MKITIENLELGKSIMGDFYKFTIKIFWEGSLMSNDFYVWKADKEKFLNDLKESVNNIDFIC